MKFGYFTLSDNHYENNYRDANSFVANIRRHLEEDRGRRFRRGRPQFQRWPEAACPGQRPGGALHGRGRPAVADRGTTDDRRVAVQSGHPSLKAKQWKVYQQGSVNFRPLAEMQRSLTGHHIESSIANGRRKRGFVVIRGQPTRVLFGRSGRGRVGTHRACAIGLRSGRQSRAAATER